MNPINRISSRGSIPGSTPVTGGSKSKVTAQKVSQLKIPILPDQTGLAVRQLTRLEDAQQLYKKIQTNWNRLAPEELAEGIIELEDKVALLSEVTPEVAKVKELAKHLHFQFVFPLVVDLAIFAKTVHQIARRVLQSNSVGDFNQLSQIQQREVGRYAVADILGRRHK